MIILHMLPLVQSLNNPFTKVTDNGKYYISTKVTYKAKFYMNTPHMLPDVRVIDKAKYYMNTPSNMFS